MTARHDLTKIFCMINGAFFGTYDVEKVNANDPSADGERGNLQMMDEIVSLCS